MPVSLIHWQLFQQLLKRSRFLKWLRTQDPNRIFSGVGIADCPLEQFIKAETGLTVNVARLKIWIGDAFVMMPAWAIEFITRISVQLPERFNTARAIRTLVIRDFDRFIQLEGEDEMTAVKQEQDKNIELLRVEPRFVRIALSDEEIAKRKEVWQSTSAAINLLIFDLQQLKRRHKEEERQFAKNIKSKTSLNNQTFENIKQRSEECVIHCQVTFDRAARMIIVKRTDNHEIIETRTLTAEEQERYFTELPLFDTPISDEIQRSSELELTASSDISVTTINQFQPTPLADNDPLDIFVSHVTLDTKDVVITLHRGSEYRQIFAADAESKYIGKGLEDEYVTQDQLEAAGVNAVLALDQTGRLALWNELVGRQITKPDVIQHCALVGVLLTAEEIAAGKIVVYAQLPKAFPTPQQAATNIPAISKPLGRKKSATEQLEIKFGINDGDLKLEAGSEIIFLAGPIEKYLERFGIATLEEISLEQLNILWNEWHSNSIQQPRARRGRKPKHATQDNAAITSSAPDPAETGETNQTMAV